MLCKKEKKLIRYIVEEGKKSEEEKDTGAIEGAFICLFSSDYSYIFFLKDVLKLSYKERKIFLHAMGLAEEYFEIKGLAGGFNTVKEEISKSLLIRKIENLCALVVGSGICWIILPLCRDSLVGAFSLFFVFVYSQKKYDKKFRDLNQQNSFILQKINQKEISETILKCEKELQEKGWLS